MKTRLLPIALLVFLASGTLAADRASVSIQGLKFAPQTIEIKAGDTVVWTNNDDREHTVTADDGSFESGRLKKGKSFSHTFTKPGRYGYGSDPSPRTKGVVVVR
jgi:plastocyanin